MTVSSLISLKVAYGNTTVDLLSSQARLLICTAKQRLSSCNVLLYVVKPSHIFVVNVNKDNPYNAKDVYNIIVMYVCDKSVIVNFKDSMLFLNELLQMVEDESLT